MVSTCNEQSIRKDLLIVKQTPAARPFSQDKQDYLHHCLNPPYDTRHDNKVVGIYGGRRIENPSQRTRRHDEDSKLARGRLN